MNDLATQHPSVSFLPSSGVKKLEPGVTYAVALTRRPADLDAFRRPVKAALLPLPGLGESLVIADPVAPENTIKLESNLEVVVLGRWEDPMERGPLGDGTRQTWQGYAAQQLGEVLRHNYLAERLTDFGIPREPEAYLPHQNTSAAVRRSMTFTYEEVDKLLRAAGF